MLAEKFSAVTRLVVMDMPLRGISSMVPDLTISLDIMPVTFVILGLRPCFKVQYGLYGHCPSSFRRVLNDIG